GGYRPGGLPMMGLVCNADVSRYDKMPASIAPGRCPKNIRRRRCNDIFEVDEFKTALAIECRQDGGQLRRQIEIKRHLHLGLINLHHVVDRDSPRTPPPW